jgi:hypothetical protein
MSPRICCKVRPLLVMALLERVTKRDHFGKEVSKQQVDVKGIT